MYTPSHFEESRPEVLRELMRRHPLATLITVARGEPAANHLPLMFDAAPGAAGVLRGHVARANAVWREVPDGSPVLAVFQGPDHYVTPSWYPAKTEHGKVVPTWNYAVVHARGTIAWHEDPAWLRGFLDALTDGQEAQRAAPWRIDDAPTQYIERMLGAIVGFEIPVVALTGKWKLGQNRSTADRAAVATGLAEEGTLAARGMIELLTGPLGPRR
ncbi:MAG TPA: FMN-binding negative transcriptional regulator [Burkholderiales bacterium]|nr:FMN-binding negative transcriptional regulator [Burkholderiales bacterium]